MNADAPYRAHRACRPMSPACKALDGPTALLPWPCTVNVRASCRMHPPRATHACITSCGRTPRMPCTPHAAPRTPHAPDSLLGSGHPLARTHRERCGRCEVLAACCLVHPVPVPAAGIAACRAQPHQRIPTSVSTHVAVGTAQPAPRARLCYVCRQCAP